MASSEHLGPTKAFIADMNLVRRAYQGSCSREERWINSMQRFNDKLMSKLPFQVEDSIVVITAPPDARYSPLQGVSSKAERQTFDSVRALVLPVLPGQKHIDLEVGAACSHPRCQQAIIVLQQTLVACPIGDSPSNCNS